MWLPCAMPSSSRAERDHRQHRAEDLLAGDLHLVGDAVEDGGLDEIALAGTDVGLARHPLRRCAPSSCPDSSSDSTVSICWPRAPARRPRRGPSPGSRCCSRPSAGRSCGCRRSPIRSSTTIDLECRPMRTPAPLERHRRPVLARGGPAPRMAGAGGRRGRRWQRRVLQRRILLGQGLDRARHRGQVDRHVGRERLVFVDLETELAQVQPLVLVRHRIDRERVGGRQRVGRHDHRSGGLRLCSSRNSWRAGRDMHQVGRLQQQLLLRCRPASPAARPRHRRGSSRPGRACPAGRRRTRPGRPGCSVRRQAREHRGAVARPPAPSARPGAARKAGGSSAGGPAVLQQHARHVARRSAGSERRSFQNASKFSLHRRADRPGDQQVAVAVVVVGVPVEVFVLDVAAADDRRPRSSTSITCCACAG